MGFSKVSICIEKQEMATRLGNGGEAAAALLLESKVCEFIPNGEHFNMTDLIQRLLDSNHTVVSFPIIEYWLDIGQLADYE